MAPLSKLTLTSYRRTQPNRDPVEEWLSKIWQRSKKRVAVSPPRLSLIYLKHKKAGIALT